MSHSELPCAHGRRTRWEKYADTLRRDLELPKRSLISDGISRRIFRLVEQYPYLGLYWELHEIERMSHFRRTSLLREFRDLISTSFKFQERCLDPYGPLPIPPRNLSLIWSEILHLNKKDFDTSYTKNPFELRITALVKEYNEALPELVM